MQEKDGSEGGRDPHDVNQLPTLYPGFVERVVVQEHQNGTTRFSVELCAAYARTGARTARVSSAGWRWVEAPDTHYSLEAWLAAAPEARWAEWLQARLFAGLSQA